ncbi:MULTISPECIES: SGNH/GDSL hydrolase family protein [Catenuloplanes]|uniref:Lysophospholipase L1-like esterase n=1 Tax=Catenuloplanes niger TaxID=587534 RepID=A0AAE4CS86_9ACTN|nr:SGNH/GDSL hydrolase family protein [Catenuloplanes niger]MDR7322242.1 lysophospholipase L1-like esterase [Catenuloplanes niger]
MSRSARPISRRTVLATVPAVAAAALTDPRAASAAPVTTPSPAADTRVGIWGAALNGGGPSFANQTIRHVVYASSAGTAPRLRISNRFGTAPLVLGHVDLAEQSIGGVVKPGTHHRVTFGGLPRIEVPAGQEIISDPVDMTINAGVNLLVSIYIANAPGPSVWHPFGLTRTYISVPGDHAADDASTDFPPASSADDTRHFRTYYLAGVDVVSASATGTIVAFGDSLTDGFSSTALTNRRYPDYLARRLHADSGGAPRFGVVNAGLAGNRVLLDSGPTNGLSALNRFTHDALLGHPNVRAVILLEGVNDINSTINSLPVTSWDLRAAYQTLINQAHARGVAVYGGTILPYAGFTLPDGTPVHTPAREATRAALNGWIRTSGAFDAVIDFDAALRDPANPTMLLPAYAHTDHLHLTDAGMQALAAAVVASVPLT